MKKLLILTVLLFNIVVSAKEYTNTSYYVAYDSNDNSQYALVMPSVNKIYTHKAGHILPADLKQVDTQFSTFPTYNNGKLCFSALKSSASGKDGASIMSGKCYDVNFFYTQKEALPNAGMAFILTYTPEKKVYEGLAGNAGSFKVVRDGDTVYNKNSVTGDDYTIFNFEISTANILMGEILTKKSVASILTIVTIMDNDLHIEGVLGAGHEAQIALLDINDTNLTLTVSTSRGDQNISNYQLSDDKQTMSFVVPLNIVEGELSLQTQTTESSYSYKILTVNSPYLIELTPDAVQEGESVTFTGKNLPSVPVQVVFEDQNSSLTQTVTPSGDTVSFTVPSGAGSGSIYLRTSQIDTNRLYLSIKRSIDVKVVLGNDVDINTSKISFIQGLEEFILDTNYSTRLSVENKDMQYINAVAELSDGKATILYSAVVLPDMTGTVAIDANSTAISWIFIGMGVSTAVQKDKLRTLYDSVSTNAKVQEFAAYINALQKDNLDAWADLIDTVLISKYQDALRDVLQNTHINKSMQRLSAQQLDPNTVVISSVPVSEDIQVDDNIYKLNTLWKSDEKLNNGTVNIVNDTRLFLSIEVRDKKTHEVINGYHHLKHPLNNYRSLISPKGWAITQFSSLKNLDLQGKDSTIQIVAGSAVGATDKPDLARGLSARVFLEGMVSPSLNMIISTLINRQIDNTYGSRNSLGKRVVSAMSDVYGTSFWVDLMEKFTNSTLDISVSGLVTHFVTDPVKKGLNDCVNLGFDKGKCEQTAKALLELTGVGDATDAGKKILIMIAKNIGEKIFKNSLKVIPYYGQILAASDFVYNNIGQVSDFITVTESLYDRKAYPREINIDVDFPLEVSKVAPTCTAFSQSDTLQRFYISGGGFAEIDSLKPLVYIGTGDDKSEPSDLFVNNDATQMVAKFHTSELMDDGSWESNIFIKHMGISIMYDKMIRMVSTEDEKVYFDSVVPDRAMLGQTVTLNGCGWVPLDNVKVFFDAYYNTVTEAEIISKTIDKIEVKVPSDAKSGLIYVTTGENKKNAFRLFDVIPFGIFSITKDKLEDGTGFVLEGKGLTNTVHIYFTDNEGNTLAGITDNITDTSMWVEAPTGLKAGNVRISVVLGDGMKSNELIVPKVPKSPTASPISGFIGNEGIVVLLTQAEGADIYYRLNDKDSGTEQLYSGPITLTLNDMKYTELFLYAFSRVTINGVNYDSDMIHPLGTYDACPDGEILNESRECMIYVPDKEYTFADWQKETCPEGFVYSKVTSGDYEYHRCKLSFYDTYDILTIQHKDGVKTNEKYNVIIPKNDGEEHDYNFMTRTVREVKYSSASGKLHYDENNTIIKDDKDIWRSARTSSITVDTYTGTSYNVTIYDLEHMIPLLYSNVWDTVAKRTDKYTLNDKKIEETLYESKISAEYGYIAKKTKFTEWDESGTLLELINYDIKRNDKYKNSDFMEEWQSMIKVDTQWELSGSISDCGHVDENTYECVSRPSSVCTRFKKEINYDLKQRESGSYAGEWVGILEQERLWYSDGRLAEKKIYTSKLNDHGSWVPNLKSEERFECLMDEGDCYYDFFGR